MPELEVQARRVVFRGAGGRNPGHRCQGPGEVDFGWPCLMALRTLLSVGAVMPSQWPHSDSHGALLPG